MTGNAGNEGECGARWGTERVGTHGWAIGAYLVVPAWGIYDRSIVLRLGRSSLTVRRLRDGQPWPEVSECHEAFPHICPQHDPAHEHTWQAGKPRHPNERMIPVRCVVCGGRKCDRPRCVRIRHHREDHSDWLGYNGHVSPVPASVGLGES